MGKIKVRFPNESYPIDVPESNFNIKEFVVTNIFKNEVFGKWGNITVAIDRKDFDNLIEKGLS